MPVSTTKADDCRCRPVVFVGHDDEGRAGAGPPLVVNMTPPRF